jgi:serralysin
MERLRHTATNPNSIFQHGGQQIHYDALGLDPYAGYLFRDKEILTLDGVIDHLDVGTKISTASGKITYSFMRSGEDLIGRYLNPLNNFPDWSPSEFSEEQKAEARDSLQLWDDLIPQTFVEISGRGAQITFANANTNLLGGWAWAYYPVSKHGFNYGSDVFVADPSLIWQNAWLGFGGTGGWALIHELGHSLGLQHPSDYTAVSGLPFSYDNYADYAQDSIQYTVMSYFGPEETGGLPFDWGILFYPNFPQTPLVHDIVAIQSKYGADPTTRVGDTVYGWNSTAGNPVYDFSQNQFPYLAIYDAGGIDTIDMSGANASVFIDLSPGSFSSAAADFPSAAFINARAQAELGGAGIPGGVPTITQSEVDQTETFVRDFFASLLTFETSVPGLRVTSKDNISIAYGTVIENATGSIERDLLLGNHVDNVLMGLAGDDVLDGRAGADTLIGGEGADTFRLWSLEVGDLVTDFGSNIDKLDLSGTGVDFTFIGSAGFSGIAGELRFADGRLEGDVNGDFITDLIVTIIGNAPLPTDLIL